MGEKRRGGHCSRVREASPPSCRRHLLHSRRHPVRRLTYCHRPLLHRPGRCRLITHSHPCLDCACVDFSCACMCGPLCVDCCVDCCVSCCVCCCVDYAVWTAL